MNNTKKFALNAVILTATSLITSCASMSFTVFITGKIGAAGVGLYQLIMTVYRLAVTFATGGIGLASTRLVSEEMALGNPKGAGRAVKNCLFYALTLSVCTGTALFFSSEFIASTWLGDMRTMKSLRSLALSLPALSASSVLCGYFTAVRRVFKSSAVLLLEQYVKITLSVYFLGYFSGDGLENACCALVLSGTAAELFSCLVMCAVYLFDRRRHNSRDKDRTQSDGLCRRMMSIAVPVALTSYLRSGLTSVEQMMIPWGLKKYGHSKNAALAEYGIIGGMVMPVIMFPAVFISAFSGLLITEISACRALGNKNKINRIFSYFFRLTVLFSVAVAGVLCGFGGDIAMALYHSRRAAKFIQLLAPLVCVMYLDSVTDSMLKGLNLQQNHMCYNIIDSAVSILLTVTLLPTLGINGYIIVITVSELLNFILSFRKLVKTIGFQVHFFTNVAKPIISIVLSVLIMRLFSQFIRPLTLPLFIAAALAIYLCLLWMLGCVTKDDTVFVKNKFL